ncbi:UDP-N-acetylmuramyl-tripeptide synthetase [Candidatus Parcubacteria bacterium]|nr:MAG: UDP-N-acetylmuramyl-tripeptide synthetase [Candidatus Parcubacteria bacterium]
MKKMIESILPESFLSAYHFALAHLAAFRYGHPSRKLLVIAVTGTKGKSSVTEMINAILEEAGYKTAVLNSIRFKIDDESKPNLLRMSMPGRFFIQRFLHTALEAKCTAAILEMTSEGARQHRHRAIDIDALVFTNLAPEHIERHGSFEAYADAKFSIGQQLARAAKNPRIIVANADDKESLRYLTLPVEKRVSFSLSRQEDVQAGERGGHFTFEGEQITVHLPGIFSLENALAAASCAHALGIDAPTIARAVAKIKKIAGRGERIEEGQMFTVVVDYAHTPDSLKALYDAYAHSRKICVLGNTGGGRDTWKRPVMGKIADDYCEEVILTNEDPYDENPRSIVDQMAEGMKRKPEIIMDRREAIREALSRAKASDVVLISGKGTDPCICIANGKKIPWNDAEVVREELRLLKH